MHPNLQATGVIGTLPGMGKLSEWLTRKQRPDDDIVSKGVVWNARGEMQSCLFCDFANHTKEKELLYEDDLVIAFSPLKPAAKQHILVVPKRHISTVGDLVETDTPLLDRMKEVAVKLLKCDASQTQLSFHIPPWNSVDHLHLHALETPYLSWWNGLRFSEGKPWCASFEGVRYWASGAGAQEEKENVPEAKDEEEKC
ncbi:unnamed protein product [Ectocarpus sp. 4 AP-2014]